MNRAQLQRLAQAKVDDANALLAAGRWSAAFYLVGYAVECALKSCILRHIDETGKIFAEQEYLKSLPGCWTHDFAKLVKFAGLEADFGRARGANAALNDFWLLTSAGWNESSRYQESTTEDEARKLFEAITHDPNGVLTWIRTRW